MEWLINQFVAIIRNYNIKPNYRNLWTHYHYFHCAIFSFAIFCVFLHQASYNGYVLSQVSAQRQLQLRFLASNSNYTTTPSVIPFKFGHRHNLLIVLQHLSITQQQPHQQQQQSSKKDDLQVLRNRDDQYLVPFNCPCGSIITDKESNCNGFHCCACQLQCPLRLKSTDSYSSSYEQAEWLKQFLANNCPALKNVPSDTLFEERLIHHGGVAKKSWSCDQPYYWLNLASLPASAWFPYFCLHKDNLMYLGSYYEKRPKLANFQKEKLSWSKSGSGSYYSWRQEPQNPIVLVEEPGNSATTELEQPGNETEVVQWSSGNSSIKVRMASGSKCGRSLGLLRYGLSSSLPCGIQLNFEQETSSSCNDVRHELDFIVETLLAVHLKTPEMVALKKLNSTSSYATQDFGIRRKLVNITGIFEHEIIGGGQNELFVTHCQNLTMGVEIVTTFYANQVIGLGINYMKRDDQLAIRNSMYERPIHLTSTTVTVNKTHTSKLSKFWTNLLLKECPAGYCLRELFSSARPEVSSTELLLPHEATMFVIHCFAALGIMALLLLHEFMGYGESLCGQLF